MQLGPRFREALHYAAELHAAQTRKDSGVPYVAHLLSVAALVIEAGGDEDEAIAALLHDAVEDQGGPTTLAEIRRRFGDRVADLVVACSDTDVTPKPPWRQRKEAYLAHLPPASRSVQLISAADKLHNVRSIVDDYRTEGSRLWQRFNGGRDGTLWYHQQVLAALDKLHGTPLYEQLARAVDELRQIVENESRDSQT